MHTVLVPAGSSGDVLPLIALGRELLRRGHEVSVFTNPHFSEVIEKSGMRFLPFGTREDFDEITRHPDLWHPTRSAPLVFRWALEHSEQATRDLLPLVSEERCVIIGGSLAFPARLAAELTSQPLVSVHLQPTVFASVYQAPVTPSGRRLDWMPLWLRRLAFFGVDRLVLQKLLVRPYDELRARFGLAPFSGRGLDLFHAGELELGLFPSWFAAPQPDWPASAELSGFPAWGGSGALGLPKGLQDFLGAGEAPVLLSPGSANRQAENFFAAGVDALRMLGQRGLLLTPYHEQLPSVLPDGVAHFDYAPFEQVLPRCAAFLHHGGVGSVAQAFAAGVPQLIHPFAFDQPDNAVRVRRLKFGDFIRRDDWTAQRVSGVLQRLLADRSMKVRLAGLAAKMEASRPVEQSVDLIERKVIPGLGSPQVALN